MTDLLRQELVDKYHSLYKRLTVLGEEDGVCFYCGEPQRALDHRPPLNALYCTEPTEFIQRGVKFLLVPSCQDCNARLSGFRELVTLEDALKFLLHKLRSYLLKHGTIWTDDEMAEMHPDMQINLRAITVRTLALKERIKWMGLRLKNLKGLAILLREEKKAPKRL